MLIRLIYASTVRDGVDLNELKRILAQSQANNQRRDLTGILAFNSKIVLQALEGGREEVNALYAKLLRDDRHHTVTMLKYQEVEERMWAQWSMGFAAQHADNRAVFLKYSRHSTFNPYAMGGDAVEKMLCELAGKTISMTVPLSGADAFGTGVRPAPAIPPITARPAPMAAVAPVRPAAAPTASVAASTAAADAARPATTGLMDRFLGR